MLGQKWLEGLAQRVGGDHVLVWGFVDVDVPHLFMEDFFLATLASPH